MTMSQFQSPSAILGAAADFRTFGAAKRAALTAAGLVRTSDTGQIDWTTATVPATNTAAGYEIWRFADAAQATQPIFLKLEYGMSSSVGRFAYWITVGTGADGAGNITGIRQARTIIAIAAAPDATLRDVWVAHGDGYVCSGTWALAGSAGLALGWSIERFRNADGTVDTTTQGAGLSFFYGAGSIIVWTCATYDGAYSDTARTGWPSLTPTTQTGNSGLYRGTTYAFPIYPVLGYLRGVSRAAVVAYAVDASPSTPFTVSLYGLPHIFRHLGWTANAAFANNGTVTNIIVGCLRYE